METFKTGDFVKLKIGGPKMSVFSIEGKGITCQWFEKLKLSSGVFQPEQLEFFKIDNGPRRVHDSNHE